MVKDDEERIKDYIDAQIEKAKLQAKLDQEFIATELQKSEEETLTLDMKLKELNKIKCDEEVQNPLKKLSKDVPTRRKESNKRRIVALEEIIKEETEKKRLKEKNDPLMQNAWRVPNIIVKINAKSLGDKFYKKKGRIIEVIDDFAALIELNDGSAKIKVDQDDLETVIPNVGRKVIILWGKYSGQEAELVNINTKKFEAELQLVGGKNINLPYEQFSKQYIESDECLIVPSSKHIETVVID